MNWLQRVWRGKELDRRLDKELLFHLEEHVADLVASGVDPEEAKRRAMIELGGAEQVRESCREIRGARWLFELSQDLSYALRSLRLRPGFAVVALLTLGLGIGITTVMFTIANSVLLKPLPYREPDRLLSLHESLHERVESRGMSLSHPSFQDVKRENRSFGSMAAWLYGGGIVSSPGDAQYVWGREISAGLFSMYGVKLRLGREFSVEEDRAGGVPVAMISEGLWRSRFAKNPGAIGRGLVYGGKGYTVVGVFPEGFELAGDADVYIPLGQNTREQMRNREMHMSLGVVARLRPGVSVDQARAELRAISRGVAARYPKPNTAIELTATPLKNEVVGNVGSTLGLLMGAVVLVLLIGCANLATLLLVRAAAREREVAMRIALGASRGRLIRQCLTESSVIALLGGALGLALAAAGIRPFLTMWPGGLPRMDEIQLDWQVLLFTFAVSLLSSLLFGLAPALRAPTRALEQALRSGTRTTGGPRRMHGAFVASEIAITMVLLVSAGLLGQTLIRLSQLDPGLNPNNVLTAQVSVSPTAKGDPVKTRAAWQEIADRVGAMPGVDSAAMSDIIPMIGSSDVLNYWTTPSEPPAASTPFSLLYITTPSYLRAMGIKLLEGRFFTEHDRVGGEMVVVVDEVLARRAFQGASAVGRRISLQMLGPARIIGVVAHVRHWGMAQDDSNPLRDQMYFPFAQIPDPLLSQAPISPCLVVRTAGPSTSLISPIERAVRGWGNDQAMHGVRTMDSIVGDNLARHRFLLLQFGIFAGLALLLAGIGIYGVVSHLTGQRMQEFGVRMALGATGGDVVRLALRQSIWMVVIGVVVGAAASIAATRALTSAAGASAKDPWTFAFMTALLVVTALLAGFVPARRAGLADPARILRRE